MPLNVDKLNNPVWYSLMESHQQFSLQYNGVRFYNPKCCPFGALEKTNGSVLGMNQYSKLTDNFYVVGTKPDFSNRLTLKKNLVCNQMILENPIEQNINEQIIELESRKAKNDLFDLVNKIQPGYIREHTSDLGRYYGIYQDAELIAVTGERMKMNQFTEISAVVTHPDYTGRGYAKRLVTNAANQIFKQGRTPFLHVAESNIGAIKLYEKLGFRNRRKISFWHFVQTII